AKNEKLRAEVTKVENAFSDYREKHEIRVGLVTELGQKTTKIARLTEDMKKLREELGALQLSMTPVEDEPEAAHGLSTRAELVKKIRVLGQDVLDGVKFGFDNIVDQLKVLNPKVELNTEGLSMLKRVENGQVVIPTEYAKWWRRKKKMSKRMARTRARATAKMVSNLFYSQNVGLRAITI
ncbi:hypothetical protein A2U01_0044559, partial [Trifolium medium]|nr:hypothetical protein [Trifolium medium]